MEVRWRCSCLATSLRSHFPTEQYINGNASVSRPSMLPTRPVSFQALGNRLLRSLGHTEEVKRRLHPRRSHASERQGRRARARTRPRGQGFDGYSFPIVEQVHFFVARRLVVHPCFTSQPHAFPTSAMAKDHVVLESLVAAASGSIGAACACVLLYPLDEAKTRRQAGTGPKKRGKLGFLAGALAKSAHAACAQFVFFYAYAIARRTARDGWRGKDATSAFLAAMATVCATHGMDTWATRQQVQMEEDEDEVAEKKESGWTAAMVLTVNPVVQYVAYEAMRRKVVERKARRRGQDAEVGTIAAFVVGAASKCIATITTYPLVRAKVLQQLKRTPGNLFQVLVDVYRKEGMAGWYRGLKEQLFKTVLQAAVMLAIKERMDRMQRNVIRTWRIQQEAEKIHARRSL